MVSSTVNVCAVQCLSLTELFNGLLLQVVRYTALLSGVFYGIYHRRTLQNAHDADKAHHAKHERETLIAQAKEAWKQKQAGNDGGE